MTIVGPTHDIHRPGLTATAAIVLACLALVQFCAAAPPENGKAVDKKTADRLFDLHLNDAGQYEIFRDDAHRQTLELRRQPVYLWSNPTRDKGQTGAVFVWTYKGRPEAIGSIFSHPSESRRMVVHEMHSLSSAVLEPVRDSENRWEPRGAVAVRPVPAAAPPADSAKQRQFQLRALSREFSARSIDYDHRTWELRLLPKALFQYESPELGILDGALFAFVTSAGTDPEVVLLIEAQKTESGPHWQFAVARFSDHDLIVDYQKTEVWKSIRDTENTLFHDPQHTYRLYQDRLIDEFIEVQP